ncbi:UNVERIFIED_CONTAM: hypothetical protein FKN15_073371 [Acipenser sinensis]
MKWKTTKTVPIFVVVSVLCALGSIAVLSVAMALLLTLFKHMKTLKMEPGNSREANIEDRYWTLMTPQKKGRGVKGYIKSCSVLILDLLSSECVPPELEVIKKPKRGNAKRPQPRYPPAEGEYLLVPPQPPTVATTLGPLLPLFQDCEVGLWD